MRQRCGVYVAQDVLVATLAGGIEIPPHGEMASVVLATSRNCTAIGWPAKPVVRTLATDANVRST